MLATDSSGRIEGCTYCGAGKAKVVDAVGLAQTLAQKTKDIHAFVEKLAETLESGFAAHTKVERKGLLSKKVHEINVEIRNHVYRLEVDGQHAKTHRAQHVRGVRLKDEQLQLHHWIEELSAALAQIANESEEARAALSKFTA